MRLSGQRRCGGAGESAPRCGLATGWAAAQAGAGDRTGGARAQALSGPIGADDRRLTVQSAARGTLAGSVGIPAAVGEPSSMIINVPHGGAVARASNPLPPSLPFFLSSCTPPSMSRHLALLAAFAAAVLACACAPRTAHAALDTAGMVSLAGGAVWDPASNTTLSTSLSTGTTVSWSFWFRPTGTGPGYRGFFAHSNNIDRHPSVWTRHHSTPHPLGHRGSP